MKSKIISEIWIYPIKSLGGIRLHAANVLPKGLEFDRRWMLIDAHNHNVTQRNLPQLCLFQLSKLPDKFIISHSGQSLDLPFSTGDFPESATIWDDIVEIQEVSKMHSEWFSDQLKMTCRLVFFPEKNPRLVNPRYRIKEDHVGLADSFPILIIGQSSLDDLNSRLKESISMNRFRPNIVFLGGEPFEEDGWKIVSIGSSRFAPVKPCSRCALTTINQETGEKGTEPLATLSTFRNRNGKVYFGQYLIPLDCKSISEGDEIE